MKSKHAVQRRRILAASAFLVLAVSAAVAYAVHDDNFFELGPGLATDENGRTNILGDGVSTNGPDWADLFDANGALIANALTTYGGTAAQFVKDDVSAGGALDSTAFPKGGSDKNSDYVGEWNWQSASVPSKDDITNAYVYAKTNAANGHLIVYAGIEREDPSGSSHVDLEFFQNAVALSELPPCDAPPCTFTGANRDNDLLVTLDFSNGGAFAGLKIFRRDDTQKDKYTLVQSLNGQGCNAADTVCAFANGGVISGGPWPNYDNHGAVIEDLPTNAFSEFGVDVTALLGSTPCFATVQVKTRSSPSFTAELKDFALASFEQCNATVQTEIHSGASSGPTHTGTNLDGSSVSVGTTIHDKAIVTGTPGFATPTGSVTFFRYANGTCAEPPVSAAGETVSLTQVTAPTQTTAGVAAAESGSYVTTAGSLSYKAVYNGDTNYDGEVSSACESLTVNKVNSAVNTDIKLGNVNGNSVLNTKIANGTTLVDVATVTGTAPGTPDPTGSVTFTRYPSANCTGTGVAETITLSADSQANGSSTAVSSAYTTTAAAGEFVSYKVVYSGDSIYNPSQATLCEPICSFDSNPTLPPPSTP